MSYITCARCGFEMASSSTRERDMALAAHFVRHAALAALVKECLDGVVGDCTEWNERARKLLAGDS